MAKQNYTTMKVFDYLKMSLEAQEQFEEYYEDKRNSNCYIWHSVEGMYDHETRLNAVDAFLMKQGVKSGEAVLIHEYW